MSSGVVPLGKIVYMCDDVVQDPLTGNLTVVSVFNAIHPPDGETYPYRLLQMCVFAQFAGGLGPTEFQVKVLDAATGVEVFGSPSYRVNFPGGQMVVTIRMLDCPFPQPGTYLAQLFCQNTFVDDRRLTAQ